MMCTHSISLTQNKSKALGVVCSLAAIIGVIIGAVCHLLSASKAALEMNKGHSLKDVNTMIC